MSFTRRNVYRHADLRRLFAARSVAIVGASPNPANLGTRTIDNLEQGGFRGEIFAVNGKYDRLQGRVCHASVAVLPEAPDCVVIATPREAVEPIVLECVERGVGGIIVYASGYLETPKPGRAEQQGRLVRIAQEAGIPLLGPNCIGLLNYATGFHPSFVVAPQAGAMRRQAIGLISQSGALAFSLAQAVESGMCLSHVLTSGNACDVDIADQISYLADDPTCASIACVLEGMSNPERLLEAADLAFKAGKVIVMYKMARGEQGAAAAMSHTGSLAGSDAVYSAAFRRAGIVAVDNLEALLETAAFFAKAPARPTASGVAVLAASGGSCIIAADKAETHGVALPQPGPQASSALKAVIPEFGTVRNPCDVTALGFLGEGMYTSVNALMADERYGALVLPRVQALPDTQASLRVYSEAAARHGKVACSIWLSMWAEGPGARETEADPRVALFRSTERCFSTLAAWHARDLWARSQPRQLARRAPLEAAPEASRLLTAAGATVLTEREAKQVLKLYGVPVVEERLTGTVEEALQAARDLGFPLAMKVESPDIAHKTEAGVIRLNVSSADEVAHAFRSIMANAVKAVPDARLKGVLLQPMVPAGVEVMVGARVDPLFGPVVVAGLGGTLVELMNDTATALAPVSHAEALAMLEGLKGKALLEGFRGAREVSLDRLADVICRLSELVSDLRDGIVELDVNPFVCAGDSAIAVDALIVRRGQEATLGVAGDSA